MKKLSETIKKLLLFLLGMSIIQFGVALFLRMNIGSDPFTVFTQGLANTLNNLGMNVTTGTANRIILVVLFMYNIIIKQKPYKDRYNHMRYWSWTNYRSGSPCSFCSSCRIV